MIKEENHKRNTAVKNGQDSRSRSHSPKAYYGCDTCKLKKNKSNSKLSDCSAVQDKIKIKNHTVGKAEKVNKNRNIKLTDLCDEDKKRLVELIEELSKLAESNQQLKELVDELQKERHEQQEYAMKQANLYLEEKNLYVNEISKFKNTIQTLENEMKSKSEQWEIREKSKNNEISYLARSLQKSVKEKKQLYRQLDHLKLCLKHSLESFQRLRAEVSELQRQEMHIKHATASCQTENKSTRLKERHKVSDQEETEDDEFLSTCNHDSVKAKSSLDIINDKLEYVYQMLKSKDDCFKNTISKKPDIDLTFFLKNEKPLKELGIEYVSPEIRDSKTADKLPYDENEVKFQKPFEECSKTSVQAERILQKFGKPLNLVLQENSKTENNLKNKIKESSRDLVTFSNFLQQKIIQKNTLFKSSEEFQYDEDKLLEELFYPEQSEKFGAEYDAKQDAEEPKTLYEHPFLW